MIVVIVCLLFFLQQRTLHHQQKSVQNEIYNKHWINKRNTRSVVKVLCMIYWLLVTFYDIYLTYTKRCKYYQCIWLTTTTIYTNLHDNSSVSIKVCMQGEIVHRCKSEFDQFLRSIGHDFNCILMTSWLIENLNGGRVFFNFQ